MASDGGPFQQQLLSMVALGRNFKIGDLYDYRYDQILKGNTNLLTYSHILTSVA